MEGAATAFAQNRIRFILSEVGFISGDSDMTYFGAFHDAMETRGFLFCGLYDAFRCGPQKRYIGFGNALYINPHFSGLDGPA